MYHKRQMISQIIKVKLTALIMDVRDYNTQGRRHIINMT